MGLMKFPCFFFTDFPGYEKDFAVVEHLIIERELMMIFINFKSVTKRGDNRWRRGGGR